MRVMLSVFLALHGVAHLVGFVGPWGLSSSVQPQGALFGGRLPLGSDGMKAVGVLWLLTGLLFVAAGIAGVANASWVTTLIVVAAAASLLLGLSAMPAARIGVAINIAILVAFVIASRAGMAAWNR